jgi:hypothetical protein
MLYWQMAAIVGAVAGGSLDAAAPVGAHFCQRLVDLSCPTQMMRLLVKVVNLCMHPDASA